MHIQRTYESHAAELATQIKQQTPNEKEKKKKKRHLTFSGVHAASVCIINRSVHI